MFPSLAEIKWKMDAHSVYKSFSWTWKFDSIQKLVPFRHSWSKKSAYEQKNQFRYKNRNLLELGWNKNPSPP